ncbi:hypothetical protein VXQ18_14430 [Brucella abortus]|nr:hypothetical protein [Brucella abortus]
MENKRNFFITIAPVHPHISASGKCFIWVRKTEAQREQARIEEQQRQAQQAAQNRQASSSTGDTPQMPANPDSIPGQGDTKAAGAPLTRDAAIAQSPRIEIDTP